MLTTCRFTKLDIAGPLLYHFKILLRLDSLKEFFASAVFDFFKDMKDFLGLFSLLLNISRIELLYWWTFTSNTLLLVVLTSRNLFGTFDSFVNFFAWTWADCQKRRAIATNTVSIWLDLKFCS